MNPEDQQTNANGTGGEVAFVQQALAAADRSERTSRILVVGLGLLAVAAFVWMHLNLSAPQGMGGLLHSLLRVDLFFLLVMFALSMYLRQEMNRNTRTILRALANTRSR